MSRLGPLFAVAVRTRLRTIVSSRAGTVLLVVGALVLLGMNVLFGFGLFAVLRATQRVRPELLATVVSWIATWFGLLAISRPAMFRNVAGGALTNVLHLPFARSELLIFSFVTGILVPMVLETPLLLGATAGLAPSLALAPVVLALVLLSQGILLGTMYVVSLGLIVLTRRRWISDLAGAFGVLLFLLPAILLETGNLRALAAAGPVLSFLAALAPFLPFGWAPRAAVFASRGDWIGCAVFALLAIALAAGLALLALRLLNRVLDGEIQPDEGATRKGARARMWLPGGLGALIENEVRTILRLPAARAALVTTSVIPALWVAILARRGGIGDGGLFLIILVAGVGSANLFAFMGRRVVTVLSSPVWRAGILLSRNLADTFLRVPMLFLIALVLVWRGRGDSVPGLLAAIACLWFCATALQNFASILRPYALPLDRTNPLSSGQDGRQTAGSWLSAGMTFASVPLAAPFLFLVWLGATRFEEYEWLALPLAVLGAAAVYAVCIDVGGRMLERREPEVLEKLLDDRPV